METLCTVNETFDDKQKWENYVREFPWPTN